MLTKVVKFGGSSLADATQFKKVADIIKADKNSPESKLVKYADKLSAYVKCLSELKGSNNEFLKAKNSIEKELESIDSDEVKYFMANFIKPYSLTLDELD